MATTEILLLKHIKTLGAEGDQVRVRAGYARNFLFPNGYALPLTRANKKQIEALQHARDVREQQELAVAQGLADQLQHATIAIVVKTGENGKMFGAVSSKEISKHLASGGIVIDRKKINLAAPIKEIGRHKATVKLHDALSIDIDIDVVSENPITK